MDFTCNIKQMLLGMVYSFPVSKENMCNRDLTEYGYIICNEISTLMQIGGSTGSLRPFEGQGRKKDTN